MAKIGLYMIANFNVEAAVNKKEEKNYKEKEIT